MTSVFLSGLGWITPRGRSLKDVADAIRQQTPPDLQPLPVPHAAPISVCPVPPELVRDASALPRLRRSSVISHFAVAAASDAMNQAGWTPDQANRTALVFASSDGGVVYTRRFYEDLIATSEGSGSPLLFPETVYNAPASHIAAHLGLTSSALTLVGDSPASLAALHTGAQIVESGEADFCLVVAAQELDWITCEAYRRSRALLPGAFFSEGAAAVLLSRTPGPCRLAAVHPGINYRRPAEAETALTEVLSFADSSTSLAVSSATGTLWESREREILANRYPHAEVVTPKTVLGESLCCSALQHIVAAAWNLHQQPGITALVPAAGFNGQMAAAVLTSQSTES